MNKRNLYLLLALAALAAGAARLARGEQRAANGARLLQCETETWCAASLNASDGSHLLVAGNWCEVNTASPFPSGALTVTPLIPDVLAPGATFTINGGASKTAQVQVSLAIAADDGLWGVGVDPMRLSADGINWTPWQAFRPTQAWMLDGANGPKTVYLQLRDHAGNDSAIVQQAITLERGYTAVGDNWMLYQ
jgi:hypothetical protein